MNAISKVPVYIQVELNAMNRPLGKGRTMLVIVKHHLISYLLIKDVSSVHQFYDSENFSNYYLPHHSPHIIVLMRWSYQPVYQPLFFDILTGKFQPFVHEIDEMEVLLHFRIKNNPRIPFSKLFIMRFHPREKNNS